MKTALIVTDMQNGFMNRHTRRLASRIKSLLKENLFDEVIFTKFINLPHSPYVKLIRFQGLLNGEETEIVEELKPYARVVFTKNTYGPFTRDFESFIKKEKITRLCFVGVDTNACVMKGAVDAFEKGYVPLVLGYYCGSHSGREFHDATLKNLRKLIGKKQVIEEEVKTVFVK